MGVIAITMFAGVTALAIIAKVHIAEHTCDLVGFTGDCATDPQRTVIAQLAAAVFGGDRHVGFYFIQAATALILILAANTAFNGFPLLASILAQHRYLPRQLHNRGDRLAFSNGILLLAAVAGLLLYAFDATVTASSSSTSSACSPPSRSARPAWCGTGTGNWPPSPTRPARRVVHRSAVDQRHRRGVTGLVLVIVLATKFTQGAWLVVVAIRAVRADARHPPPLRRRLRRARRRRPTRRHPSRMVHAIVLVSTIHKPTLRALAYARAIRPDLLEALTVTVDPDDTADAATRMGTAARFRCR